MESYRPVEPVISVSGVGKLVVAAQVKTRFCVLEGGIVSVVVFMK